MRSRALAGILRIGLWTLPGLCFSHPLSAQEKLCRSGAVSRITPFTEGRSWDTWATFSSKDGRYHSYSQWVPANAYTPGSFDFHNFAKIYHRSSNDGVNWTDLGLISIRGESSLGLNDHAYWSGSAVFHAERYYLFYTRGGNETSIVDGDQRILMATSRDGHNFTEAKEIFSPESLSGRTFGTTSYTFQPTLSGQQIHIPSLRDPHITKSLSETSGAPSMANWYLLFSTNLVQPGEPTAHGIGVARSENLKDWTLQAPLKLPGLQGRQVELPNVMEVAPEIFGYKYLLMASARSPDGTEIIFWGGNGLREPWYKVSNLSPPPKGSYGFNFVRMKDGNPRIVYFDESNIQLKDRWAPIILSPSAVSIEW